MGNPIARWLVVGTVANLGLPFVYILGCAFSGWTCHGDRMGGIMMSYGITFFLPNLVLVIFVSARVFQLRRTLVQSKSLAAAYAVSWIIFAITCITSAN